jgi:protein BCP1
MKKRKAEAVDEPQEEQEQEEDGDASGSGDGSDSSGSGDSDSAGPSVSEEEESADDEDGEAFNEVQVDFKFFDPQEPDFHGLRTLLHNYLDGADFDSSGLTDAVIDQVGRPRGVCQASTAHRLPVAP